MASKSLNRVVLMGNLTRDPELKYTPQGTAVCTFGLATNRGWTTTTGELKEDVQYHRIVAWQKLAELCAQLLKKGRKVYLEGRIVYRSYTGKDGQERQSTEIIMSDFISSTIEGQVIVLQCPLQISRKLMRPSLA
ncbi:MAG: Single-stranded DNA-binding protein [Microgenomates bacterium OLB22]|nr:MAG: Single-stranded DNA-binding protein [Microgenomates bacterium OLB22]